MRVLMLSWEYPPLVYGGLGRHVHALAEALAADHEVVVATQAVEGAPPDSVTNGVRVVRTAPEPPGLDMSSDLLAWVAAFERALTRTAHDLTGQFRPDVVHAHDWPVAGTSLALRDRHLLPLVVTVHATEAGRHQGWLPNPLSRSIHGVEWQLTHAADRLITCSTHMRWESTRLFDLPTDAVDVIPNGVDLNAWATAPGQVRRTRERYASHGPLLVFTGRLEWEKGCHTLLDAMPTLRSRHPGLRLVVTGRGSTAGELQEQARTLQLGHSVLFLGWVPDEELRALLAAADAVVVPSVYEPFGLVALEAAAAGAPLVLADTGGMRDVMQQGVPAMAFRPTDEAGLADAVTSLLSDPALGHSMAREARTVLARDYAWPGIAQRTADSYGQAAKDQRTRPADRLPLPQPPTIDVGDRNLLMDPR